MVFIESFCVCDSVCVDVLLVYFSFFFFKQKTAYEMRISDWSSDVCSSDLLAVILRQRPVVACACGFDARTAGAAFEQRQADRRPPRPALRGIDRKSVV